MEENGFEDQLIRKIEDKPKGEKFVKVDNRKEIQITACAVSKMDGVDCLSKLLEYANYFVEPNQAWLSKQDDPFAWVKVYYKINPESDSITTGAVQVIKIPMEFLGEDQNECWAEVQILTKPIAVKNDTGDEEFVWPKLGRHQSYDKRVGKLVDETEPMIPKKDMITHRYVSLRLYYQDHLPEVPENWRFEPVYAAVADRNFFRIDAEWKNEEITIIANLLDGNSPEIPSFLKQ